MFAFAAANRRKKKAQQTVRKRLNRNKSKQTSGHRFLKTLPRNPRQVEMGRFVDVTKESGIADCGYGSGVAVGDVNNDGWPDIFFSNYGDDSLFLNQQNGKFANVSKACGIKNPSWSTSASFFDFDRDGDLDLFVANYVSYIAETKCANATGPPDFCSPAVFGRTSDRLFRNVTRLQTRKISSLLMCRWSLESPSKRGLA